MAGHSEKQFTPYRLEFKIHTTDFLSVIKLSDRAVMCGRPVACMHVIQPKHITNELLLQGVAQSECTEKQSGEEQTTDDINCVVSYTELPD
jgi:hypothetical protein